eukprot:scaffold20853_cov57-Phaeocystis_antarctica.AAC.2
MSSTAKLVAPARFCSRCWKTFSTSRTCADEQGGIGGRAQPVPQLCLRQHEGERDGMEQARSVRVRRTLRGHSSTLPARKSEPAARCCHRARGRAEWAARCLALG